MKTYCAPGSSELRACGCHDWARCHRTLPTLHKNIVYSPATHAADGYYPALPGRKGSPYRDGAVALFQSADQRNAEQRRLSDQNITTAESLGVSSQDTSRNSREEEDGLEVSTLAASLEAMATGIAALTQLVATQIDQNRHYSELVMQAITTGTTTSRGDGTATSDDDASIRPKKSRGSRPRARRRRSASNVLSGMSLWPDRQEGSTALQPTLWYSR
jgi:hypothetical protein